MSLLTEEDARALASISADPARAARSDDYRRAAVFRRELQRIQRETSQLPLYVSDPIVGNNHAIIAPSLETLRNKRKELWDQLTTRGFPPQLLRSFLETERELLNKRREQLEQTARARHRAVDGAGAWDTELCAVEKILHEMSPTR